MLVLKEKEFPFILTEVKYEGENARRPCLCRREHPKLSLQRLAVYVETKKELDRKLKQIPGGNLELIGKLYAAFDAVVMDELECANTLISDFNGTESNLG